MEEDQEVIVSLLAGHEERIRSLLNECSHAIFQEYNAVRDEVKERGEEQEKLLLEMKLKQEADLAEMKKQIKFFEGISQEAYDASREALKIARESSELLSRIMKLVDHSYQRLQEIEKIIKK